MIIMTRYESKLDKILESNTEIKVKIGKIEEHLNGINGFVEEQKNYNEDNNNFHKGISSQINMARGAILFLSILSSFIIYFKFVI